MSNGSDVFVRIVWGGFEAVMSGGPEVLQVVAFVSVFVVLPLGILYLALKVH